MLNELKPLCHAVATAHKAAHASAREAVEQALLAGSLLLSARQMLPPEEIFTGFVESCSITIPTAYRYMALAQRALPEGVLRAVLAGPAEPEAVAGALRAPDGAPLLEPGASLTQLYREYGIIRRGRQGGARPGAGRKRVAVSGAEAYEARMGAIHSAMAGFIEAADGFSEAFLSALRDEDRAALRTFFRDILGRIERA